MKKRLRPLFIYFITLIFQAILWLLVKTCRVEVNGIENLEKTLGNTRSMIMFWHNQILLMIHLLYYYAPRIIYTPVISKSRDADILEAITKRYPHNARVLRIAHNARRQALFEMEERLKKNEVLLITPDGPRGPRYTIKTGVAWAAKEAEATILPITWSANRFWQLKSWDRFIIPKPFAKIIVDIGDPIKPSEHSDLSIEERKLYIQEKINAQQVLTRQKITSDPQMWPS